MDAGFSLTGLQCRRKQSVYDGGEWKKRQIAEQSSTA
jgi:hypothetical protein